MGRGEDVINNIKSGKKKTWRRNEKGENETFSRFLKPASNY